ncbi:THAP domain-containing protein 6 [Biomphalaria glabrata]|nr:THAP domain-containing protein 6 [Biomphalaria glabrata]
MKHYRIQGITFFRFPHNLDIRQKWIKAMERGEEWNPDAYDFVDSTHFTDEDFDEMHNLKPQAIPTIFGRITNVRTVLYYPIEPRPAATADDNETLNKVNHVTTEIVYPSENRTTSTADDKGAPDKVNHVTTEIVHPSENRTTSTADDKEALDKCHDYAAACPQILKHKLEIANNKVAGLRRKLRSSKGIQVYYKRKAVSLKKDLKEKNKLIKELKTQLEQFKDFPMHLFTKPSRSSTRRAKNDVCPVSVNDDASVSTNNGSSLSTNNGSSVSTNNGSSVSTNNGSSVSTNDGSSTSVNDGSSVSVNHGSPLIINDVFSLLTNDGSPVLTNVTPVLTNDGSPRLINYGSLVFTNDGSLLLNNDGTPVLSIDGLHF